MSLSVGQSQPAVNNDAVTLENALRCNQKNPDFAARYLRRVIELDQWSGIDLAISRLGPDFPWTRLLASDRILFPNDKPLLDRVWPAMSQAAKSEVLKTMNAGDIGRIINGDFASEADRIAAADAGLDRGVVATTENGKNAIADALAGHCKGVKALLDKYDTDASFRALVKVDRYQLAEMVTGKHAALDSFFQHGANTGTGAVAAAGALILEAEVDAAQYLAEQNRKGAKDAAALGYKAQAAYLTDLAEKFTATAKADAKYIPGFLKRGHIARL